MYVCMYIYIYICMYIYIMHLFSVHSCHLFLHESFELKSQIPRTQWNVRQNLRVVWSFGKFLSFQQLTTAALAPPVPSTNFTAVVSAAAGMAEGQRVRDSEEELWNLSDSGYGDGLWHD